MIDLTLRENPKSKIPFTRFMHGQWIQRPAPDLRGTVSVFHVMGFGETEAASFRMAGGRPFDYTPYTFTRHSC